MVGKYCAESPTQNLPLDSQIDSNTNNRWLGANKKVADCRARCSAHEGCNFFSFSPNNNGDCLLYKTCPAGRVYGDGTKGTVTYMMAGARPSRALLPSGLQQQHGAG